MTIITRSNKESHIFGWRYDQVEANKVMRMKDEDISLSSIQFMRDDKSADLDEVIVYPAYRILEIDKAVQVTGLTILRAIDVSKNNYRDLQKKIKELPKEIDPESEDAPRVTKYLRNMAKSIIWINPARFVTITVKAFNATLDMLKLAIANDVVKSQLEIIEGINKEIVQDLNKLVTKNTADNPNDIPDTN